VARRRSTYPPGYDATMETTATATVPAALERRGRWWLALSFLACPCHLPVTLALLGTVLGGTALGALLHQHTVVAGVIIAAVWILGTGRGFVLIGRAGRGELACPLPRRESGTPQGSPTG
jgi:hypothetical protein